MGGEPVPLDDPDDEGVNIAELPAGAMADDTGKVTAGGVEWSPWTVLADAVRIATTSPGVYLARAGGSIVYVGMAGERFGQGVRGRLTVYARGRAAVSGLGEAVLDRALADRNWITTKPTSSAYTVPRGPRTGLRPRSTVSNSTSPGRPLRRRRQPRSSRVRS